MNKVELTGRLTRDPDVRQSETQGGEKITIARYTLAVDRKGLKNHDNAPSADFVPCVAFGRAGDFASKYLTQGIKIGIVGHIQTGFYINKEGKKIYTVEVAVEEHEFEEPKKSSGGADKIEAEYINVATPQDGKVFVEVDEKEFVVRIVENGKDIFKKKFKLSIHMKIT